MDQQVEAETRDVKSPPLSKNQLKKLKRNQEWEANRDQRKVIRKQKLHEKKQRERAARQAAAPTPIAGSTSGVNGSRERGNAEKEKAKVARFTKVPITLVLDCGFDDLMNDKERKSLGSQVTRCYSDNHKAPFQTHLIVSSFGGLLKERFDGLLAGHYRSWKNVRFLEGDFMEAADKARGWMREEHGGQLAGALAIQDDSNQTSEAGAEEVVYLTSDSPNTLTKLRPHSTYIIGGLVDRNRHKGVCYKRAMDRGMKTAKLPISEYMQMTSRYVLTTNHVTEISLRWLEFGDWGKAFSLVMPKRKGGVLKVIEDADGEASSRTSRQDNIEAETANGELDISSDSSNEDEMGGIALGNFSQRPVTA